MLNGKLKKALVVTLTTLAVIGNTFAPVVQARTYTDVAKNVPITKVIDCNKLTEKMLTHRSNKKHHIMYIERIIGKVTDNKKNGKIRIQVIRKDTYVVFMILNPPVNGGYYISYASVKDARKGDIIITYCVYNPYSNYDDDVIERWDFIE